MMFQMHGADLGDRMVQLESHRLNDGTQIFKVVERNGDAVLSTQIYASFEEAQLRYGQRLAGWERQRLENLLVGPKEWSPRTKRCRCKMKGA